MLHRLKTPRISGHSVVLHCISYALGMSLALFPSGCLLQSEPAHPPVGRQGDVRLGRSGVVPLATGCSRRPRVWRQREIALRGYILPLGSFISVFPFSLFPSIARVVGACGLGGQLVPCPRRLCLGLQHT